MPKPYIRNVIESSVPSRIIPEIRGKQQKIAENQRLLKASSILPADQDGEYVFISGVGLPNRDAALKRIEKLQKEQKKCFIGTAAYNRKEEKLTFATRLTGFSLNFNSEALFRSSQALLEYLPEGTVCPDGKGCVYVSWILDREYTEEEVDALLKELKEIFAGRATVTPRVPWNGYTRKAKFPGEVTMDQFEKGVNKALGRLLEAKGLKKPANMAQGAPDSLVETRNDSGDESVGVEEIQGYEEGNKESEEMEVVEGEQYAEVFGLEEMEGNMETEQEMADTKPEAENDTLRFMRTITPEGELIHVRSIGEKSGVSAYPDRKYFSDPSDAALHAQALGKKKWDVYLATASFKDTSSATTDNFRSACSCPIDFDVAANVDAKHYGSKADALAGMQRVKEKLFGDMEASPLVIVDSGNGIQAHVILTETVDVAVRKRLGTKIEKVCIALGEKPDTAVTKDAVRIMRVPGTFNYKGFMNGVVKPVTCLEWNSGKVAPSELESRLDELLGVKGELASADGGVGAGGGVDDPAMKNLLGNDEPFVLAQNQTAITSLLEALDPNDEGQWRWALKLYAGCEHFAEATEDELKALWTRILDWSSQSPAFESEEQQWAKMDEQDLCHPRGVFKHFQDAGIGWKNPGKDGGGVASAQGGLTDSRWGLEYHAPSDDILHARIFAETAARACLKYTPRGWMQYNGTVWENKPDGQATEFAKALVGELREYAKGVSDEDNQKKVLGHVQNLSTKTGLSNMVSLAKSDSRIYEGSVAAFDPDPMKFQSKNGVLDLRTGVLNPNSPDWMTTKASPVEFDALARCPKWLKFLEETFSGDGETIESLQRWLGYSMTGVVRQEHICFWAGKGSNGKSTINRVMAHIWGSYRVQTSAGLLVASPNQDPAKPNPMLVMTVGGRMLAVNEMPKHARLDDYAARQIAGTELVTTRDLNQGAFSFLPSGKITCSLNDMPRAADMSPALWRRVRIIPFKTHIADDKKNFNLADELMEEAAGILNWLIEGCVKWNTDGLIWSGECNDAVEQYKQDTDTLGDFMKRFVITGDNQDRIEQPEVWKMYREHMPDYGEVRVGKKMLFQMIGERQGVDRKPSRGKDWFIGIKLAA